MKHRRTPTKITLDAYAASHRAVREMKETGELPRRVKVRSSQYLNNLIEQDHRRIKQRIRPMLGFKRADAGIQTFRPRGGHHSRNRVGGADQEGPVQDREVGESAIDYVAAMERGARCLIPIESTDTAERR